MDTTNIGGLRWANLILVPVAFLLFTTFSQAQEAQRVYEGMIGLGNDLGYTALQDKPQRQQHAPPSAGWKPPATPLRIASAFVVTTTANTGVGSLRAAIDSTNAHPGFNAISFNILGSGVRTISPSSALPQLNYPVIIDGTTQPGFAGTPLIELNGGSAPLGTNGLVLVGGNSVVRGLVINRFRSLANGANGTGIVLAVNGGNMIEGNHIGLNADGTASLPNGWGVVIVAGTSGGNIIGGTTPEKRNVVSGNLGTGVTIHQGSVGVNLVRGNYVGTNAAGTAALGNGGNGIYIDAPGDTIGGLVPGSRNIISGNVLPDIFIQTSASGTVVQGNYISTDVTGNVDLGGPNNGINIRSSNNIIGDASESGRNIISGNGNPEIYIFGPAASGNKVLGNYIGTNAAGTDSLGDGNGIVIDGAPNNTIGGSSSEERNVISGHPFPGVYIRTGATGNKVSGNYIGVDASGSAPLGNSRGVVIDNASGNTIGGNTVQEGNLIAGNSLQGVDILNGASGNKILNNHIGTNWFEQSDLGNGSHGVVINASQDTVMFNTIAFNAGAGVFDSSGTRNLIQGNSTFYNTGLGIDLAPRGFTKNDSLDGDTGANNLQNFPLLDSAAVVGSNLKIDGRFNGKPNIQFFLDFYLSAEAHTSHFGEGTRYLPGGYNGVTDASGYKQFTATIPLTIGDQFLTATSRDSLGNTSEFSQALSLIDADGDGIMDSWETQGWGMDVNSDGIIDLNLYDLDARPYAKDIFVEVDAMSGMAPQDATLQNVADAFAIAGSNGISLHIAKSDTNITPVPWLLNWWQSFQAVKTAYFGTQAERTDSNARFILEAKKLLYRYCVFAYQHDTTLWSGRAEDHSVGNGCDDFMVTLGAWGLSVTEDQLAGTFMHELGHTLGLGHGGVDGINYKPNYISIMNYTWQMPYDWGLKTWRLDYSPEVLPALNESNLDEFAGLNVPVNSLYNAIIAVPYSGPGHGVRYAKLKPNTRVDWDSSGFFTAGDSADVNIFAGTLRSPSELLVSQDDWSQLVYNFRNSPDFSNALRSTLLPPTDELHFEKFQFLNSLPPPKPSGEFVMDGALDTSATLIASNAGINLYARYKSGQLYVATNSAQSQNADMFIFVSNARNSLRAAPSGKNGQVSAWSAFLWNDSSDNSTGWVNATEFTQINFVDDSAGTILEGVIDLEYLYGSVPAHVYIAVGKYGTDPGGTLLAQVPVGNGDGNIDPEELFWFIGAPAPTLNTYFVQQGNKLVGTGAVSIPAGVGRGQSVRLSFDGNTAIVGAPADNNYVGAAWVYTRSGTAWSQQGSKLVGTGATGIAGGGYSVGLSSDGNTAIIGGIRDNNSVGAVWIFIRSGGQWTQQGSKLVGSDVIGSANVGASVALSSDGNTAIVGGPWDGNISSRGAAWIFTRSGGLWSQQGSKLLGTGAVYNPSYAGQGTSVALSSDGNTAIIGAPGDNALQGAAWVFTRTGGVWSQQGSKLVGTGVVGSAQQGFSVSLSSDGNTALVSGRSDNSNTGAVWVFTRSAGVWSQQGSKLVGTGAVGGAEQGFSVSLSSDGNTAIVGGQTDSGGIGGVWVYTRTGGVWNQQGNKLVGTGGVGTQKQGWAVSLSADGNTAVVGGPNDAQYLGAAWMFAHEEPLPIQLGSFTATIVNGSNVRLDWMTVSEINNYGFEIQRSPENENAYGTLPNSFIPGHGTTNEPQHYSFTDVNVLPGQWYYRLKQIDLDGTVHYSDGVTINTLTGISGSQLPDKFGLSQNYPDPFNPSTTIQYQLPQAAHVTLKIYNLLGQEVVTLADDVEAPGYKSVVWNAANIASGVYFYRIVMTSGQTTFVDVRKMLVMK